MRSVEACHPRVGGANPPVARGVSVEGALISSIVPLANLHLAMLDKLDAIGDSTGRLERLADV